MKFSKSNNPALLILLLPIIFLHTGCAKEYSNEGIDTIVSNAPLPDSTIFLSDSNNVFSSCSLCNPKDKLEIGSWNFKTGDKYVCGHTTNSGFFSGNTKKDITFFGPSSCSVDTGVVVSAFFSLPLDQNRYNLSTTQIEFYYYDNNASKDIFISEPQKTFSVTIDTFNYQTRIAIGSFAGTVFRANGDTALVRDGNFKVYIK
ncbi:MAG: hypothetical protein ACTHNG_03200 [Ginsengibacter sp.]